MDAALIELVIVFGIVLGVALWDLYRIDQEVRRTRESRGDDE